MDLCNVASSDAVVLLFSIKLKKMKSLRQDFREKKTDITKLLEYRKLKYLGFNSAPEPLTNYLDVLRF